MKKQEIDAILDAITPLLNEHANSIRGIVKSVKGLEGRISDLATAPSDDHLRSLLVPLIPLPLKGDPGAPGAKPTVEELKSIIEPLIPAPLKGEPGHTPTVEEIKALIPAPIKGDPGDPGKSFTLEEAQALVTKAIVEKQSEWALDFERRATERHDRWLASLPKPKDGEDGRHAVDVDGFDMTIDGRDLTISLKRDGAIVATKSIRVPGFEDHGVWREDNEYSKGDGVSFGGSFFIAQKDQPEGKPEQSKDWRCAVKRGRDGKDVVHIPRDPNAPVKTR